MFFLWYFLHFLILINCCIGDQLCIDTCEFEYDISTNFTLPSHCNVTRREHCSVITTFDYTNHVVKIYFSLEFNKQFRENANQTENTIRTTINLAEPSFIQHSVEYFCSTNDQCDLDYIQNIAIPSYSFKSCEKFRSQIIQYLNPEPVSFDRDCYLNESTTLTCDIPCELSYENPNKISRSCDGELDLMFETTVGQSTPTNKPEHDYRIFAFACTTPLCNGIKMQQRIQNLIDLDNGECLISFNQVNETTTHIPSKAISTFSKSFSLIIFIIFFVYLFP